MALTEEKDLGAEQQLGRSADVLVRSNSGMNEKFSVLPATVGQPDVAANEDVRTPPVSEAKAKLESVPHSGIVSYRKRFLICALVALGILVSYNLLIHRIARSSQRRQLMAALERIPADTDCLFIGNSLVEAGLDTPAFQESWPGGAIRSRNIALGATYPVEHYLILKKAFSGKLSPKYVVYGFFD